MLSLRRYAVYIGLTACFLLAFAYFREPLITKTRAGSFGESAIGTESHLPPYISDLSDPLFTWDQVPVRYPVKSLTPVPNGKPRKLPQAQYGFAPETQEHAKVRKRRQQKVKQTFEHCWKSYKEHAWLRDELAPVSGSARDGFGGWAATLVDNLDTVSSYSFLFRITTHLLTKNSYGSWA